MCAVKGATTTTGRVRYSASQAYLQPAKSRSSLTITPYAHVSRVLTKGVEAKGVEFKKDGKLEKALFTRLPYFYRPPGY